jgi:hypothetical protein
MTSNLLYFSPNKKPVAHNAITLPTTYRQAKVVIFLGVGPPIKTKVPYYRTRKIEKQVQHQTKILFSEIGLLQLLESIMQEVVCGS